MGSESYSKEELIAEIGSCMLLSYFGLDIPEHNYSYIDSWLEVIKGDKNLLYESMKEVDRILNYLGIEL
jgi:antirestriction protein ArdC